MTETENTPHQVIPLGQPCTVKGEYAITAFAANRRLTSDTPVPITIDFTNVKFTCGSDGYSQFSQPDRIRLMVQMKPDDQDTPEAKLLAALEQVQSLQRRSDRIYEDRQKVADLGSTPIIGMELNTARIIQENFRTQEKYTMYTVVVRRDSVSTTPPTS